MLVILPFVTEVPECVNELVFSPFSMDAVSKFISRVSFKTNWYDDRLPVLDLFQAKVPIGILMLIQQGLSFCWTWCKGRRPWVFSLKISDTGHASARNFENCAQKLGSFNIQHLKGIFYSSIIISSTDAIFRPIVY